MNILCTICARGGSKDIKNIKFFLGKFLITHTINQANITKKISKIVCSFDAKRI